MKKIVRRHNQAFKILIESEKDGAHFALAQALLHAFIDMDLCDRSCADGEKILKKGGYYLFWGPTEDTEYKCHGIAPMRSAKNNKKWPLKKAMIEFFAAVKNSEHQSFKYSDQH